MANKPDVTDLTADAWLEQRPAIIEDKKLDREVAGALDDFEPFAGKGVQAIIEADEVPATEKAAKKLLSSLKNADKAATKAAKANKKDKAAVAECKDAEDLIESWADAVESFTDELADAIDDGGHPPEFLAIRARYDKALLDDIKKTTSGPKPYLLAFRDFAGKRDAFIVKVFRTGKVKPAEVTALEKAMRSVFGQSYETAEGVVRKENTTYIFEYPSSVSLPEKLRKQMKSEVGIKALFETVADLSEVVVEGDEAGPAEAAADGATETPDTSGAGGGTAPTTGAGPVDGPPDRLITLAMDAIDNYETAMETVDAQITKLQAALRDQDDPELNDIADKGLNAFTDGHKTTMRTGILELRSVTAPAGSPQAQALADRAGAFAQFLSSDPRIRAVDENPFKIPVAVRATLGDALRDMADAMASLASDERTV